MPYGRRPSRRSYGGWGSWPIPRPVSRPRPVRDGLRAKSTRGAIGDTWWSRRFLDVLEDFHEGSRLARGRAYARAGQVIDMEVAPGEVNARVQGSRARPYEVTIGVAVLTDHEWARVEAAMAARAVYSARLLAGEMPTEIEEAFDTAGLSLFPASGDELGGDCSCPDWGNPCKHVAAVYYLLAEAFDRDPFLVFAWRGRPRERLLAELRALRGNGEAGDRMGEVDVGAGGSLEKSILFGLAAADDAAFTTELNERDVARFWSPGGDLAVLRAEPRPAVQPDAILRDLGPSGLLLGGRPIEDVLAPAYGVISAAALRLASGEGLDGAAQTATEDATEDASMTPGARTAPRPAKTAPGSADTATAATAPPAMRSRAIATGRRASARVERAPSRRGRGPSRQRLEGLIEETTVDCCNESEERTGFYEMLRERVSVPFRARFLGLTLTVTAFEMPTDEEIVAVCRHGRDTFRISLAAVTPVAPPPDGAEWLDAYRLWARGV